MTTLVIGDFRTRQLQYCIPDDANIKLEYTYLIEDTADLSWFKTSAIAQLPLKTLELKNVVIMLGFNDCAYSCAWPSVFNIKNITTDYVKVISDLITQYSSLNFYVCSISPIETDYPFAEHTYGKISVVDLNTKITEFNTALNTINNVTFIDCYSYLNNTGFSTYDGVRYDTETAASVLSFIKSHFKAEGGSSIEPRTAAPIVTEDVESDIYWRATIANGINYGGLNPFNTNYDNIPNTAKPWDTLPNCTSYAWGRFYEILGSYPKLYIADNAETWFGAGLVSNDYAAMAAKGTAYDGYKRGITPAVGAIICWEGVGGEAGHVAVVEEVNADGSIVTSESGWRETDYWWTTTRTNANGNWGASSTYKFQGFIYCPTTTLVTKDEIRSENSWSVFTVDDAMKKNAQYIYQYFVGKCGWSINAVAALLGNMQHESGMSPSIWESTINGSIKNDDGTQKINHSVIKNYFDSNGRNPGYGLVQWTPYYKYTNWCLNGANSDNGTYNTNDTGTVLPFWDIDSQLARIDWEARNNKQWGIAWYNENYEYLGEKFSTMSFSQFITSTKNVNWLTAAFAFSYEKPASSSGNAEDKLALCTGRGADGEFWYNYLNSLPPITSDVKLRVNDFKICDKNATSITASFMVNNAESASYLIKPSDATDNITLKDITTFDVNRLIPNTHYTLEITVKGSNNQEIIKSIDFDTPQSFPKEVSKIKLEALDELLPHKKFKLSTEPLSSNDWGAWGKPEDGGYTIQLIVNGQLVDSKDVSKLQNSWVFDLENEFKNYKSKLGDTVQIGIHTWVLDNDDNPISKNKTAKTSNTICFLKQPIITYLNID